MTAHFFCLGSEWYGVSGIQGGHFWPIHHRSAQVNRYMVRSGNRYIYIGQLRSIGTFTGQLKSERYTRVQVSLGPYVHMKVSTVNRYTDRSSQFTRYTYKSAQVNRKVSSSTGTEQVS